MKQSEGDITNKGLERALRKAAGKASAARYKARRHKVEINTLTGSEVSDLLRNSNEHCAYCKKYIGIEYLTIDHCIPLSKGGANSTSNIVLCCLNCNKRKSDKTEYDGEKWI